MIKGFRERQQNERDALPKSLVCGLSARCLWLHRYLKTGELSGTCAPGGSGEAVSKLALEQVQARRAESD
jgi:hypothetical protein